VWVNTVLRIGFRHIISVDTLPPLDFLTEELSSKFQRIWRPGTGITVDRGFAILIQRSQEYFSILLSLCCLKDYSVATRWYCAAATMLYGLLFCATLLVAYSRQDRGAANRGRGDCRGVDSGHLPRLRWFSREPR
jgi:hypothetical protein